MNPYAECFTETYTPPMWSSAERQAILAKRRSGLYTSKDTRDEALVCVRQLMESTNGDRVSTLMRSHGVFNVFNTNEFLEQIKQWKDMGVKVFKCNIIPIKCGAYGDAWLMTVTPPGDCPLCPLALAFNTMVSGYSYIAKDRGLFDVAWSQINPKMNSKRSPKSTAPPCC